MKQITDAVRIQMINWPIRYVWPLGLLLTVLLLNLAIFSLASSAIDVDSRFTGAILSVYVTAGIIYLISITNVFPFALGFGVTRRAYYSAVVLLVVVESMAYGALMLLLCLLERATGGWGLHLQFFDLQFLRQPDLLLQWLVYTAPFVAIAAMFAFIGVIYNRWGQIGVWTQILAATVLLGGLIVLVTWYGWWPAVGEWFAGQPTTALFGGYPLAFAVAALGVGWFALRRATA